MKQSHQCPKCQSREIYTNEGQTKRGERSLMHASTWKSVYVDVYACVDCGYFEEYLAMKDSAMEKLKTNWKKV